MPERPHILLITADELRADVLGCYGSTVCRTPNLDRLASGGVVFENSFTPNPICVPARATLTTGNYPHVCTRNKNNGGKIRDEEIKLAAHFASQGYETYACGKLHYVPYSPPGKPRLLHGFQHCDLTESGRLVGEFDPKGTMRGLEDYIDFLADEGWAGYSRAHGIGNNDVRPCPSPLPAELHVDHWVADCTLRRMTDHLVENPEQPFLIWCSFPKPHAPFDPPGEYATMYDPHEVPAPVGGETLLADRNPHMDRERYTRGLASLSPAARRVIKAYYYGLVSHQDAQVGRVLDALDDTGIAEDTLVVYTADHGEMLGDFGTYFKCSFQEGSIRVPILWRGPGVPKGARRGQLVGLQDVLPTLASLSGCPLPKDVQGLDLAGAMNDANAPLREVYYAQCFDSPHQGAMVCDGRWKYVWSQEGPLDELYDLEEDPTELVNLARPGKPAVALEDWRERLIAEAKRLGDDGLFDAAGKLATSPLDRESFRKLPITAMGWRWF